jgi:hypothetical protein
MGTKTDDWLGERVILVGRDKDVEERNVTISFSQSLERATATRGRVPLVDYNSRMGGLDLSDAYLTSCYITRKILKKIAESASVI